MFEALQFKEWEVGKLYNLFCMLDRDHSGSLDLHELLVYFQMEHNKFAERSFALFDDDDSGQIHFKEFVFAVWNYCTLTHGTLIQFAFDLYDRDSSGSISGEEVRHMLYDVYGKSAESPNIQHIMKKVEAGLEFFKHDGGEGFSIGDFEIFARQHPSLLYPAFQAQLNFQRKCVGVHFWDRLSKRTIELENGELVSVGDFKDVHMKKHMKRAIHGSASPLKETFDKNRHKLFPTALDVLVNAVSNQREHEEIKKSRAKHSFVKPSGLKIHPESPPRNPRNHAFSPFAQASRNKSPGDEAKDGDTKNNSGTANPSGADSSTTGFAAANLGSRSAESDFKGSSPGKPGDTMDMASSPHDHLEVERRKSGVTASSSTGVAPLVVESSRRGESKSALGNSAGQRRRSFGDAATLAVQNSASGTSIERSTSKTGVRRRSMGSLPTADDHLSRSALSLHQLTGSSELALSPAGDAAANQHRRRRSSGNQSINSTEKPTSDGWSSNLVVPSERKRSLPTGNQNLKQANKS